MDALLLIKALSTRVGGGGVGAGGTWLWQKRNEHSNVAVKLIRVAGGAGGRGRQARVVWWMTVYRLGTRGGCFSL